MAAVTTSSLDSPRGSRRGTAAAALAAVAGVGLASVLAVTPASAAAATQSAASATTAARTTTVHVTVAASNDTYTNSAAASKNFSRSSTLLVGSKGGHKVSYLKFTIPAAARGHLTAATVVLTRNAHHLNSRIDLHATATVWSAAKVTAAHAPKTGRLIGSVTAGAAATTVSYKLNPATVGKQAVVSFSAASASKTAVAQFGSTRAKNGPRLVLTYSKVVAPVTPPVTAPVTPPASTPATSTSTALGLAVPGGDPAQFQAAAATGLKAGWARLYDSGSIPASLAAWPDAQAAANAGQKLWLSLAVNVTDLADGSLDSSLAAFVKTLPAGTRVTTNHEPSNKSKGITPAAFTAAWNHGASVILAASGGAVLPGPIEIQANVISKGYLNNLDPKLVKFVGLDAYDGIAGPATATRSFAQVAGASYAYTKKLFPNAPVGFGEFNSSRTTGWAQWVAASLTWCHSVGADVAILFISLDEWQKTPAQLSQLAGLLNS